MTFIVKNPNAGGNGRSHQVINVWAYMSVFDSAFWTVLLLAIVVSGCVVILVTSRVDTDGKKTRKLCVQERYCTIRRPNSYEIGTDITTSGMSSTM